jgi:peptidoglycan/LPS O-acetylase OafA/YrhL
MDAQRTKRIVRMQGVLLVLVALLFAILFWMLFDPSSPSYTWKDTLALVTTLTAAILGIFVWMPRPSSRMFVSAGFGLLFLVGIFLFGFGVISPFVGFFAIFLLLFSVSGVYLFAFNKDVKTFFEVKD